MRASSASIILLFLSGPTNALQNTPVGTGIQFVNNAGRTGLLWSSIGLAVLTSLLQGFITTVVSIAEDQAMWTFRFRIARLEHWWWTVISVCLSTSFALIVLSFLSGNTNDSVGVLALSTATAIAIVRFAIPAWRNRHFIEHRWLAWTGSSRTGIPFRFAAACGNRDKWSDLDRKFKPRQASSASDDWGFAVRPPPGIQADPTAILAGIGEMTPDLTYRPEWPIGPCVYDDGLHSENASNNISLLWGEREGFRRRVSRAINSMPIGLLKSRPMTVDGYNGEGLCLAMGILGRSKGLQPQTLVYDFDDARKKVRGLKRQEAAGSVTATLEATSVWSPRPYKVMRSYYTHAMEEQFGTLPAAFIGAATELALIFLDCSPRTIRVGSIKGWSNSLWRSTITSLGLKQSRGTRPHPTPHPTSSRSYTELRGHAGDSPKAPRRVVRPDLICFALLYLAEGATAPDRTGRYRRGAGAAMPHWWPQNWVKARLLEEKASLKGNWEQPAAWLAGLTHWPPFIENYPQWPEIAYDPLYDSTG